MGDYSKMIYIACVVYNKRIEDITSVEHFCSLSNKYDDVRIIILDNSTKDEIIEFNRLIKHDSKLIYIDNKGNIGLSKSYNKVLGIVASDDWILWADDDTLFSYEYLENLYVAVAKSKVDIITGIVKTNIDTVLSPIHRNKKDNSAIPTNKVLNNIYCINSGLCIKRSVYNVIGNYDEILFIDMIDYWLFDELHKKKLDHAMIITGTIKQNFSGTSKGTFSSNFKRFRIYSRDFNHYCSLEKKSFLYRVSTLSKRFGRILIGSVRKG